MFIVEKIKVLIVDDQVMSCLLLSDVFIQFGFKQIIVVGDGEQGYKIMFQVLYYLVIFDFNMLKMDGFGFFQVVCINLVIKKVVFIMLIVQGDCVFVQKVVQLGVNNVFVKLFIIEKMKVVIEVVFGLLK